jgi:uncharacterized protein (TIGR01777 family)
MDEPHATSLEGFSSLPLPSQVLPQGFISPRPLRIVLPGGSGQVGHMLARHFQERGHRVTVLTRGPYAAPWETVHWDAEHIGPWTETLEGADVCINLAGRSINCRYTEENRKAIYESRIRSTRLLDHVIAGLAEPPRVWLNASAATLYKRSVDADGVDLPLEETTREVEGDQPAAEFHRSSERWDKGRDFTSRVIRDWEAAFFATATPRTRKVALRSAVTFSATPGSVFAVLSNLVRLGLGGTQGSGRQFATWIHEADYARAVEFILAHDNLDGPIHICAPNPLPNRAFMEGLRNAWGMPNGLPAPSLAIMAGAFFLGTEPELVLKSCRALPGRLLRAGFEFEFPEWPAAANDLVRQWRHRRS